MITFLIYLVITIVSFAVFLWVNKTYLEWITNDENESDANLKLFGAAVGSILWPLGIPLFLLFVGLKYLRENVLP